MKKITKSLVMIIIVLALTLTACGGQESTPSQDNASVAPAFSSSAVVGEGQIKPVRAVNLSFQARGTVEDVSVEIGDSVREGDVLARLSNASQAEAQLASAKLELLSAQQALETLVRTGDANLAQSWAAYMDAQVARAEAEREWEDLNLDNIDDDIEDAESDVLDLEDDLEDAQEEFEKYEDLDEDNSRRKDAEDDLEAAQEDYNEAVRDLEERIRERDAVRAVLDAAIAAEAEAEYQWDLSADGANEEQLTFAQARLDNAEAQVAAAENALNNYIITAPFDGVVADVAVSIGEQVGPESRAVSIVDTASWVVETSDISELEVVDIEVGQSVTLIADALSDVEMDGVVTAISQSSFTQSGDVLYTVYISVDEVDERIKWGMTVEVIFEAED
ncbi:MAG TPA: HlyD family efflux transporter periplasmic adaptor subunit [Anaerolineales bacterium]|nr:HlyD family efflux transporter periplasmic adaptor subunit [Anaerolineales bacterium]